MADNNFKETVASMFQSLDSVISAKTVVGEPVFVGEDTVVIPLVDVSFGMGAGAFGANNGGGGLNGKLSPCAVLVVQNGHAKLVNVKNQDGLTKVLDLVPDVVDKFSEMTGFSLGGKKKEEAEEDIREVTEE